MYLSNMNLLQACRVAPADSGSPVTELTLPLTFLDLFWFKLHPVDRLFFYSLPGLDSTRFHDSVLPSLKDSLALTLLHYLPLAGNLLWPPTSPKPILRYNPGDAISLSVHESAADFHRLSGDNVRQAAESRPLVPRLSISHEQASVIALSLTLFPNSGFCIGISAHHAILDGKSTALFIKSWAHICNRLVNGSPESQLPPELTPVFDRTAIEENPGIGGLDMVLLRKWTAATENLSEGNPRSLKIYGDVNDGISGDIVSGTFELTPANIEMLRNRVMKTEHSVLGSTRLSTFVLSSAYAFVHIVRALSLAPSVDSKKRILIGFPADYRARLEVPVPANYIGNCVGPYAIEVEEKELVAADGFETLALKMSEMIREMDKGVLRGVGDRLLNVMENASKHIAIGIAGSNRFRVYGSDFGWGKPEKVMVQSTEKTGAISMAESRHGSGVVEIGVVLTKLQMQHFQSSFVGGLKSP